MIVNNVLDILIRLMAAGFIGALIGFKRRVHHKAIGIAGIGRELTSEIVRLLEASDEQLVNADSAYQVLNCGAYVASTTRDERLATLVISRCVRNVPPDASSASFLSLLLLAFRACAAFTDRAEYYRQIGAVTVRFAYLASGVNASEMASAMEILSQRDIRMTSAVARAVVVLEAVDRHLAI